MILEAFSHKLKNSSGNQSKGSCPAEDLLHEWLMGILTGESGDSDSVDDIVTRVIQTEIAYVAMDDELWFVGRSETGAELLDALYNYCKSYDNWQFSRWLHDLQASDFPKV